MDTVLLVMFSIAFMLQFANAAIRKFEEWGWNSSAIGWFLLLADKIVDIIK